MKDFWCFPTAFYTACWKVDHANKNLDCFDRNRQTMHPQQQGTQAILRIISMAESASRQYDAKPVYWLATRLSLKDVPILPFDIFRLGPARKWYLFGHEINPLLSQLVRVRWLDIGLLVLFCVVIIVFFDPWMRNKNLINIQPSWSHAWSVTHIKSLYMCIKGLQRSPSSLRRNNTKPALRVS